MCETKVGLILIVLGLITVILLQILDLQINYIADNRNIIYKVVCF